MHHNPARAAVAYFLIAGLAALAVLGITISRPSDPDSQVLLRLSVSRLAMAGVFVLATAVSVALAWYSWRRPTTVAVWIRSHLSPDGWLPILVFFPSASVFLVGLAVVCFRNWLPLPPRAVSHLQPAVAWVMLVATLNMLSIMSLHKADDARQPHPAMQSDPADPSPSFLRDFITGCLVVLLCISALLLVNVLIGVFVKDQMNPAIVSLVRHTIWIGHFMPEQVERTRYIASALLFPILAFFSWSVAGKLQQGVPKSTNRVGEVVVPAMAAGLALGLYFTLRQVNFRYLRIVYADMHLGRLLALYVAFVVLLLVERRYSSRTWSKGVLGAGTISIALLAGLAVISASLLTGADEYVYTDHFNAYFYSIVQVLLGKTLLVNLSNQYGFYPYFLEPVFRLVGWNVPRLTLVVGSLQVGFLAGVLFLLIRLVRSRLIAMCGFIAVACVWLSGQFGAEPDPYFQYFPHRVIFPVVLLLLAFVYQRSHGRMKGVTYALAFLACGVGLLWNIDTGVITFAAWVLYLCWETLLGWRTLGKRRSAIVIAVHWVRAIATLIAALGLLVLYTYLRSGDLPKLGDLGLYQSLFYQAGFYMLPMPLVHPWNIVVLTYLTGICTCAAFLLNRLRGAEVPEGSEKMSWVNMMFLMSLMGVGLFTVYQGRSHDLNLLGTFWSAFFLITMYADALMGRFVGNTAAGGLPGARPLKLSMVSLPLVLLFIPFFYVPAFFGLVPSSLRNLQAQLGVIRDATQGSPNAYTHRRDFMTRYSHPGQEVPIFSARYDTVYRIETRTTNPMRAPGWNELFLQSDVIHYTDYLARSEPESFLVSDEFAGAFPDLFLPIQENYVETDRAEDLALFERRVPSR